MKAVAARGLSREYDVLIGEGVLQDLGAALRERSPVGQAVAFADENVAPLYLETVRDSLRDAGFTVSHVLFPSGERQKSLARAEELYGVLYDRNVRRSDALVAVGGGVTGDLVGFVAATYHRGVGLVQVPTTLLAQVDAAVGGKVAVDFRAGKNYVGAFYQPTLVLADLATLKTLPPRELRSGAAEVAKYALLGGGSLLERVEKLARHGLSSGGIAVELVADCVNTKLAVVSGDEREEGGARAALNLGHTVGHAVEAAGGFRRYTHGEAVALGLRATLWLSSQLCGLSQAEVERGLALLDGMGLPARLSDVDIDSVIALLGRDKKAGPGGVACVLLEALGRPRLGVSVPEALEREAVAWLLT